MDYSQSLHDDNPVGASPWGSSPVPSPQHARTSSYPTAGEGPHSPTPYSPNQSGSYAHEDTMGEGNYNRSQSSSGTAFASENDGHRPDTAESVDTQPNQHEQQAPTQQQQYQAQPQRQEAQRHYPPAREAQPQTQQASNYKLQAKITGLERTGRKDPILRFDVHVSI